MATAGLLKTARSLDQNGPETIDSRLARLWEALAATSADNHGSFYASEEVALRWLLKSTSATGAAATDAETLRRWPLTWHILASFFRRIPLFTLAKTLAERRFIAVLQQTARDLDTRHPPKKDDGSVQKKRKKWQPPQFDLDELRGPRQRLASASALFGALQALLTRIDAAKTTASSSSTGQQALDSAHDRIGAEQIKSFFCTSAAEAMTLLAPLLRLCRLALVAGAGGSAALTDPADWMTTFCALWDLHLQGPSDADEVATKLAVEGCDVLDRLLDLPGDSGDDDGDTAKRRALATTSVGVDVRRHWAVGLQRFLTRSILLPARAAYLTRSDLRALEAAGEIAAMTATSAATVPPVLLYLALRAPRMISGAVAAAATNRDNERWLQAAFDRICEPLHACEALTPERRNAVLADLLDMAAGQKQKLSGTATTPALASLQDLCRYCALPDAAPSKKRKNRKAADVAASWTTTARPPTTTDWRLIASVAQCDADAFLVGEAGEQLLDDVLAKLPDETDENSSSSRFASAFLVALAKGSASARSLPGFITRWHASIGQSPVWLSKDVRAAVAEALQASLTKKQLLDLLDELVHKDASEIAVSHLAVFDAISAGIRLEELEDAVGTKMLDALAGVDLPSSLAPDIQAIRWRLTRRTLAWVDSPAQVEAIWATAREPLASLARQPVLNELTFEAFICSFALWMALRFGGAVEQEAREATWSLFGQFQSALTGLADEAKVALLQELTQRVASYSETAVLFGGNFDSPVSSLATYLVWMLCGSSRFVDEMTKSNKELPGFLDALLSWRASIASTGNSHGDVVSASVLSNFTSLQNDKATSVVIERYIDQLEKAGSSKQLQHEAMQGLLHTPTYLLSRRLRERIVSVLLPREDLASKELSLEEAVLLLDLFIHVTRERGFGDVDFDSLVRLGKSVQGTVESASQQPALGILDRFRCVAVAVFQHCHLDTDKKGIFSQISAWDKKRKNISSTMLQIILLQAALLANKADSALADNVRDKLAALIVEQLRHSVEEEEKEDTEMTGTDEHSGSDHQSVLLLLAFDAVMADGSEDMQTHLQKNGLSSLAQKIKKVAADQCSQNRKIGWKWKVFMARHLSHEDRPAREVRFQGLFESSPATGDDDSVASTAVSLLIDGDLLRDYLAGETAGYGWESLLSYIQDLVAALDDVSTPVGQLLAIQNLLGRLFDIPGAAIAKTANGFELGTVHSKLAQRLSRAASVAEAKLLAQTLRLLLLDDKAGAAAMGQWNIDSTLGAVALAVAVDESGKNDKNDKNKNSSVRASPVVFDGACRLVEAVLKRHRLRLEGRFHLLVSTLQALLARLVAGQQEHLRRKTAVAGSGTTWVAQAKRFSRLLELVCEPSTAAVATIMRRGGGSGGSTQTNATPLLHSATDAAKRSAGQHMYVVLMTYIKLQIDGAVVARGVREALEPGLFSVLSITSDETRRLLNDAVDVSGRALFKYLYRRWLQFGKWKGV